MHEPNSNFIIVNAPPSVKSIQFAVVHLQLQQTIDTNIIIVKYAYLGVSFYCIFDDRHIFILDLASSNSTKRVSMPFSNLYLFVIRSILFLGWYYTDKIGWFYAYRSKFFSFSKKEWKKWIHCESSKDSGSGRRNETLPFRNAMGIVFNENTE